ncbi:MAG TPA: acyl-ACP--UDP-N-acetylglucosamine O-acyltransferase [Rhizomicrobium sp.]|nr:acyl-ACP--UDP-N-acetylglucosamine O-acyltransferase [Rhizomicrobium sp.]
MAIHPTAVIEDGARLAANVEVGPYCLVGRSVVLGDGVKLASHVVIGGNTEIGPRTQIYSHAVLGGDAQMRTRKPSAERLVIGADNVIRENVTISCGSHAGRGTTEIGDRNYFMAGSHIGHDCVVANNVTLANATQLGGHVQVGDGVNMGGNSAAQQFGRIGRYAFISGLSGVTTDVIPYGLAIGLQVRLGGLNLVGLRRLGIPRANIHALRAAFRAIFLDWRGSLQENAKRAQGQWGNVPEVAEVIAFILADAKRPICPARRKGVDRDEE